MMREPLREYEIITKDFLVTGESFNLIYDEEKKMLKTFPQPSAGELQGYYESSSYISHSDIAKGFMDSLYHGVKKYTLALKLRLITSLHGGSGTLLDIGTGTGDFLKLAKENNWNVRGVEPNIKAAAIAKQKGIDALVSMDDLKGEVFDVVTLWHVLEHLSDLENMIQKIENFVKPGGLLIVAVPNFRSYDAKYYKNYWAAYDVPRHLWHFSKKSIGIIFSSKMKIIKIKPMIFDSFYVSLLSEKYKTGNQFSIRALFVGLWSNLSALHTKESSSLIYCLKKDL